MLYFIHSLFSIQTDREDKIFLIEYFSAMIIAVVMTIASYWIAKKIYKFFAVDKGVSDDQVEVPTALYFTVLITLFFLLTIDVVHYLW